jgi:hypothetical protein
MGHAGQPDALRDPVAYRRHPVCHRMECPPDLHSHDPRDHGVRHLDVLHAAAHHGASAEPVQRRVRLSFTARPRAGLVPALFSSMNIDLRSIFSHTLNLEGWKPIVVREDYVYEGVAIPSLRQEVYHKVYRDEVVSVGIFSYNGGLSYMAWGLQKNEHCSYHALLTPEGKIEEIKEGCPNVLPTVSPAGLVTGFSLGDYKVCATGNSGM